MVVKTQTTGPPRWLLFLLPACFFLPALVAGAAPPEEEEDPFADLKALSLEELVDVEITSVSKKAEKLSKTAAAVHVITSEEIRRSGATSIPDLLRTVPGLHVARIDAHTWAVTARGFNGQYANKLLVLIDGRSVYSPLFSGVNWEQQDTLLEDIERIEVIRGPGASVWGANAVNGVINIITRHARDSQGGLVSLGFGNEEEGFARARYGGAIGKNAWYRVYGKFTNRDDSNIEEPWADRDNWDILQGGFRFDWDLADGVNFTFQGDTYEYEGNSTLLTPFPPVRPYDNNTVTRGTNLLTRCTRILSDTSELSLQLYFDRVDTDKPIFPRTHDTFDAEVQHRFALGENQDVVWGFGYRSLHENVDNTIFFTISPESRRDNLLSAFVQDEITVVDEIMRLTVGTKVEHNDYTGYEIQPTARLLWTPHESHTVWAAASRAVRTPSTIETGDRLNNGLIGSVGNLPVYGTLLGNDDFDSEDLVALELGYRVLPAKNLSLDFAAFYNTYDNLRTFEVGTTYPVAAPTLHLVTPFMTDNRMDGRTYGAELSANWVATDWWRLRGAYTFLQMDLETDGNSADISSESAEDKSPHHQVSLRSSIDLTESIEFDAGVRYVDRLPGLDIGNYTGFDLRLAYRPRADLEFALVGQDIFRTTHSEYSPFFATSSASKVERSVYVQVTLRF